MSDWSVRDIDAGAAQRLASALGVSPITARCLTARGIGDAGAAESYLQPRLAGLRRPSGLAGLEGAVARIARSVEGGERIGVFGDYDVDGVTTTALITTFLEAVGVPVVARVARRAAGYGFRPDDAQAFIDAGCRLVITGDCGTSDLASINVVREARGDVIVIDHHTVPATDVEHPAFALVNPFRADSTFPFRGMASVGLAFYVMASLRTHLRDRGYFNTFGNRNREPDMRELLDLVALGTIADLVPLQGENRILTSIGLRQLAQRRRPGIAALLHVAGVEEGTPIDERTVGWKLGPRLNAPGRLGDAAPALALLMADERTAMACAERLEEANELRRAEQDRVFAEAYEVLGDADPGRAVVVSGRGWTPGVVGIVASRLVERYGRPAFVIAVDPETGEGRGSCRTVDGVNVYDALHACEPLLERFGGHAAAAGLTVREENIAALRESVCGAVAAQLDGAVAATSARVDAEVALGEVDEQLTLELGNLAPFGKGNEEPLLLCRGLTVTDSRRVGDGSHLKLEVEHNGVRMPAIAFKMGDLDPGQGAVVNAVFAPVINEFRGTRTVELEIRHLEGN